MTSHWKSTINNAYISSLQLHPLLHETIPSLIKDEIQQLANLTLFQTHVQSRSTYPQVPVDMKFTNNSLHIRISKNGPWIPLSASSESMTPEEKAVDAVRRDVMRKIALLWGKISSDSSSNEIETRGKSAFRSSTRHSKGFQSVRSRKTRRAQNKRRYGSKKSFTNISRNKLDCSTHTINNYYCSLESYKRSSNSKKENLETPTTDTRIQRDNLFHPLFKYQNYRDDKETGYSNDSSSDESDDNSTSSFDNQSGSEYEASTSDKVKVLINFSDDASKQDFTDCLNLKPSIENKNPIFSSDSDIQQLQNSSNDDSENNSTSSFNNKFRTDLNDKDSITLPLNGYVPKSPENFDLLENRIIFSNPNGNSEQSSDSYFTARSEICEKRQYFHNYSDHIINSSSQYCELDEMKNTIVESHNKNSNDLNSSIDNENPEEVPFPATPHALEDNIEDDYEFIHLSDVEARPPYFSSTTFKSPFAPMLFSPKNPFHLEKYSHLLKIVKETLSECSSDENLQKIKSILTKKTIDSREKYRQYVDAMRELLQETMLESSTRKNLEKLCYAQFTKNIMTSFIEEFLQEATNNTLKSPEELSIHTIADAIITTNNQLKNSPSKKELIALYSQKLAGELGLNFDPTKYSNIPEVRSIHTVKSSNKNKPYQIIYMRHGTPTMETGMMNPPDDNDNFLMHSIRRLACKVLKNYNATTVPEYGAFLNRAKDLNQPVFYINHQQMIIDTSAENNRSRAIQNHEISHPNHFFFMTLPLDGVILNYIQDTDEWKKGLIDNLTHEKNGFRLPTALKKDFEKNKYSLEKQFRDLLDQLHNLYFGNKPLDYTDQQTLLMIFYSYLKDFIKEKYQIQIMVSACKDNKDRGNTSSSIDEAIYNLRLGRENDSSALYDLYIRFFAPFIIKYEHIVPKRFKVLTSVLQHIATLTDNQKQAIREFQVNDFQILDQKVPR